MSSLKIHLTVDLTIGESIEIYEDDIYQIHIVFRDTYDEGHDMYVFHGKRGQILDKEYIKQNYTHYGEHGQLDPIRITVIGESAGLIPPKYVKTPLWKVLND